MDTHLPTETNSDQDIPPIDSQFSQETRQTRFRLFSKVRVEPDYQRVSLRPRYQAEELELSLRTRVAQLRTQPIEFLESQLYRLTHVYMVQLGGQRFTLEAVRELHPIIQLKREEGRLSHWDLEDVNLNLELILNDRPSVFVEYKLVAGLLSLSSALLVQWRLWSPLHFAYRNSPSVGNVPLVDMKSLNADLLTMDTLWLSQSTQQPPLQRILNDGVKQLAVVLQAEALRTFSFMLRLNGVDFRKQPSIDGYLAAKIPVFRSQLHVEPDYTAIQPVYQQLHLPGCCLYHSKGEKQALRLRSLLQDLDYAYRSFERALLGSLLAL